jgi:hypothetical protein
MAGLVLAFLSAVLINVAYLREHDAAVGLPALSLRRPLQSARLLLGDRSWLLGFGMESGGFLLYVAAVALAPLSLVQSIAAGGIGVLAFASARLARRPLAPVEVAGGGRRGEIVSARIVAVGDKRLSALAFQEAA